MDCIKSVDCFDEYGRFYRLYDYFFPNTRTWDILPFLCIIFKFLYVLYFSKHQSFSSLVNFPPRYFYSFYAILNGINASNPRTWHIFPFVYIVIDFFHKYIIVFGVQVFCLFRYIYF